jgi:hypothetical protein
MDGRKEYKSLELKFKLNKVFLSMGRMGFSQAVQAKANKKCINRPWILGIVCLSVEA